ncbi:hypothetical protein CspeluHIS016_0505250 [Cutaneotrichosporon spelunceum]|uniref:Xylanolytic transcriptional activator regulatory domain-containing protein n=1 Tax=Cutaneotrichosporon spelunceum TaxID=1672016 RepID=A0AAD3YDV5_9TREE|nr:hypothetical protein CspeluHIS016_0505250 [Cutaneotrichosporon spelunceum]
MSPPFAEPPRKRKKRAHFSCAECRRLKLKCDRQGKTFMKPSLTQYLAQTVLDAAVSISAPTEHGQCEQESLELRSRLDVLEQILANNGIDVPDGKKRKPSKRNPSPPSRSALGSASPALADALQPDTDAAEPTQLSPVVETPHFPFPPAPEVPPVRFDFSDVGPSRPAAASAGGAVSGAPDAFLSPSAPADDASPEDQSFGTLVISQSGRSKYLGPTAASEWLKDQEVIETPPATRLSSPGAEPIDSQFPFGGAIDVSTQYLLSKLPPLEEACVLVDAYYRYFSWAWNVSTRETFQPIFDSIFRHPPPARGEQDEWLQGLALVYITLGMGALHNLELPPNDPLAQEFFSLAKSALAKGQFMIHNTLAAVQTLHIMAHFCLEMEKGRNGDNAWPLWGLAMRLIQAMGLHRDGQRWHLPPDILEERRRVFWECHTADIFQANCFSRPNSINADYIDTMLPRDVPVGGGKGYMTLKHELSRVLDHAMKVQVPPYSAVMALHDKLTAFETEVPFHFRCRAALLALPSRYPDAEKAIADSPEESKRDLHRTFQQFTLYLNLSESIIFLHRPYFARALHDAVPDPTLSVFGQSYLTVVERCNVIIQIVARINALHPNVAARHWFFWYHAFNAAVCVGTLILTNPANPLAGFALSQIDAAIALYTGVVQGRTSRRMIHNLQWLMKLRQRASDRIARETANAGAEEGLREIEDLSDSDEVELLGWRTRLIQRATHGATPTQTATTIALPSPRTNTSPNAAVQATLASALAAHFEPTQTSPHTDGSTDALMAQFWDPMLLQDMPDLVGSSSFKMGWDWDSGGAM